MRELKDLNLKDHFLFANVMSDMEVCRKVLEKILNIEIDRIEQPNAEKALDLKYGIRAVRFDVYTKEKDGGRIFDVEIQNTDRKDLGRRCRYYSASMDMEQIQKRAEFRQLPESYVIFICTYDPFNVGDHIYSFDVRSQKRPNIELRHGVNYCILNTRGTADDVDDEMRDFLRYIENSTAEQAAASSGELSRLVHERVKKVKQDSEMGANFMTFQELLEEDREEGRAEGRAEGREEGRKEGITEIAKAMKEKGIAAPDIAECTGLSLDEIEKF